MAAHVDTANDGMRVGPSTTGQRARVTSTEEEE